MGCDVIQMSSCANLCFSRVFHSTKKSLFSERSGTSTHSRTSSSRKVSPSCRQKPRMTWLSQETAPNRNSNSETVSMITSSGIALPSLNRRGRRISKRRYETVIGGRAMDSEFDSFSCQMSEGRFGHNHFARGPTLARKPANKIANCSLLRFGIWKSNENHNDILRRKAKRNQFKPTSSCARTESQ